MGEYGLERPAAAASSTLPRGPSVGSAATSPSTDGEDENAQVSSTAGVSVTLSPQPQASVWLGLWKVNLADRREVS